MSVAAPPETFSGTMDVDEFTAFLETRPRDEWWQLIEGVAVMMNPPTVVHQRIALNLCYLLDGAMRARGLDLHAYVDIGVRIPGVANFQPVPDVVVMRGIAPYDTYVENFQLVAEVLSPTNTPREVGLKLRRYREAADNLYALVIEQRKYRIEVYARSRGWEPLELAAAGELLELPEFGLRCLVGDLYRNTPLDPAAAQPG